MTVLGVGVLQRPRYTQWRIQKGANRSDITFGLSAMTLELSDVTLN